MGFLSSLFGGSSRSYSNNDDDYVSEEDYNHAQSEFRKMYDAQQSGNDEEAQELWNKFKKDTGYKG